MDAIFMNYKNSKTPDTHSIRIFKILLNLTNKDKLKGKC